uniref:BACK domain-containing protein n=1 Tax=Panagrolaimus sp. ES5 TaxID=591445 RepID=A0AC34GEN6_9BILA
MSDLELIGKIITQHFFGTDALTDADFNVAKQQIDHVADTAIYSSDNQIFIDHKVIIESRWSDAPIYSTSDDQFQMDLQIPASLISLLINFFHFRTIIFPSLDDALDLFSFALKISNQQLQKVCLDGIKKKMSPTDILKVWNHSKALRKHKSITEYVTYHFPLVFDESEIVKSDFKSMPLNDAIQLLKLRKLNIQSEKDLVPFIIYYVQHNHGDKIDGDDMLKMVNAFMDCFRIQNER